MKAPATPTKATFVAYNKPDFTQKRGKYTAQLNPSSYDESVTVTYRATRTPGTSTGPLQFVDVPPRVITLELIFDTTGILPKSPDDLAQEIQAFKDVVCMYQGKMHCPYYVKIYWGKMKFGSRLTSMDISYTQFQSNGAPVRAKAKCVFTEFVDAKTQARKDNQQSPDVTHAIQVREGDTLPLLCYQVYGSPDLYPAVAKFNDLIDFRVLAPGQQLIFPPLVP